MGVAHMGMQSLKWHGLDVLCELLLFFSFFLSSFFSSVLPQFFSSGPQFMRVCLQNKRTDWAKINCMKLLNVKR